MRISTSLQVVIGALGCLVPLGCSSSEPAPPPAKTGTSAAPAATPAPASTASASTTAAAALPPPETPAPAANPPNVRPTLVVGKRVFVLPAAPATRKPKAPPGKGAQVIVGHGVAAPAWVVDPEPVTPPVAYTLVRADGACVDPGKERLLVGIPRADSASADDAEWLDAVELKACALKTAPAAGGVFWDQLAVEGEHKDARFVQPKSVEGEGEAKTREWLKKHLASDKSYSALNEKAEEASVYGFDGAAGLLAVQTHVGLEAQMALKVSLLLRVLEGDKLVGTLREASPNGLLVLGERRFLSLAVDTPTRDQPAAQRLFELTGGRLFDAGEIKVPPAKH